VVDVGVEAVRIFLHLLAATVWVGGQLVLAGLVPVLKRLSPEAPRAVAVQFGRIAWPAFGVLVLTGIWNILAVGDAGDEYRRTLELKLAVVLLSGVAAYLHARATTRKGLSVWGALTALSAIAALFLGVLLD
jgi:putative copper export protein